MCLDGTQTLVLQGFVDIKPPHARLAHQIGVRLCMRRHIEPLKETEELGTMNLQNLVHV